MSDLSDLLERSFTRRDALRATLAGGVLLAAGGVIGCGDNTKSGGGAAVVKRARGGTLRVGVIGTGDDSLDAHIGHTEANTLYAKALYDGLMQFDHQYRPQPALAEEVSPAADARSWTIRLRPDATFHDGKPVTPEDVMFSLRRILDPSNGATAALLLASIDPRGMRKRDAHTLELKLRYPDVTLAESFAKASTGIVPVGYDPRRPIGSGPFKIASFDPARRVAFAAHKGYYRAGRPYLDALEFAIFKDATALFDALGSGAVDGVGKLTAENVTLAQRNSRLQVVKSATSAFDTIVMRCDQGPFRDVRVRQAMKELVDREQFVNQVYAGRARVGNDLPAIGDAMYASSIPQRTPDPEKARALLKAAGVDGFQVDFYTRPDGPFLLKEAEVFAQQVKPFGVDVTIKNITDVGQFYTKYFGQTDLQSDAYFSTTLWTAVAYGMSPDAPYNTAHWSNARALKLFSQARGTVDEAKRKDLLVEAQRIFWEDSGWIIQGFQDSYDALSTRFTGIVPDPSGSGINGGRFEDISLAA